MEIEGLVQIIIFSFFAVIVFIVIVGVSEFNSSKRDASFFEDIEKQNKVKNPDLVMDPEYSSWSGNIYHSLSDED